MRRFLLYIFFLPVICTGQTIVQGASIIANVKPNLIGVSDEDVYIWLQRKSIQLSIEEFSAKVTGVSEDFFINFSKGEQIFNQNFTPEVTGVSEDFFISFVKQKPVFLFNETADITFSLNKPTALVLEKKDAAIEGKETPKVTLGDQGKPVENSNRETLAAEKSDAKNQPPLDKNPEKQSDADPKDIGKQDQLGNQNRPVAISNESIPEKKDDGAAKINTDNAPDQNRTALHAAIIRDEPPLPKYHALIIGVSNYKYAGPNLGNLERPVLDATMFSETLLKYYEFRKEDVHLLKDASRAEIIDALEELGARMTDKDNLIVFYAGHGYWDENLEIGYWLPSDAVLNKKSSWIMNSTIKDYVGGIRTKHSLLISDACFSGSIFKVREVGTLTELGVQRLYQLPSRKAMTSGNMRTVPDKSKFFEYLNKRLVENQDKYLSARQLFQNFYVAVINNTNSVPQYGVIQETGDEGGEFIFMRK